MRMIAEYLEHAIRFEQLAEAEPNPTYKEQLQRQATAYRKLAENRAKSLNLPTARPNANAPADRK